MAGSAGRELAPQRWDRLRQIVRARRVARVAELCRKLRASPATIRRDLEALEKLGQIRRVHGGAVSVESALEEPLFDDKTSIAAREKHRIALAALELVGQGETVFLDGGSTVLEFARLLRERGDVTVVTNSLRAVIELAASGPRVILAGGELRRLSQTAVGPLTGALLESLHIDRAFMGTMGLTLAEGLTTTDPAEAHTKRLVMGRSREVVLLADGGKVGKVLFASAGRIEDIHVLVTDRGAEAAFVREIRKRGVRVIAA